MNTAGWNYVLGEEGIKAGDGAPGTGVIPGYNPNDPRNRPPSTNGNGNGNGNGTPSTQTVWLKRILIGGGIAVALAVGYSLIRSSRRHRVRSERDADDFQD